MHAARASAGAWWDLPPPPAGAAPQPAVATALAAARTAQRRARRNGLGRRPVGGRLTTDRRPVSPAADSAPLYGGRVARTTALLTEDTPASIATVPPVPESADPWRPRATRALAA